MSTTQYRIRKRVTTEHDYTNEEEAERYTEFLSFS